MKIAAGLNLPQPLQSSTGLAAGGNVTQIL